MNFTDWLHEPDQGELVRACKALKSNPSEALKLFEDLAKAGSAMSMLYIGYIYSDGLGRARDLNEAEKWFRQAANAGSVSAQYSLGNLYARSKRLGEAREAFAIAGAQDYGPALNQLGRMYAVGSGVEKDLRRARQYLERASAVGHLPGRVALARLLMRNPGSRIDKVRGLLLYVAAWPTILFRLLKEGYASERLR